MGLISLILYVSLLIQRANTVLRIKIRLIKIHLEWVTQEHLLGVVSRSLRKVFRKLEEMDQSNISNRNGYHI